MQLQLLDGSPLPEASYRDKVRLIVNVASYCGYTGQYQTLEQLQRSYGDRGLQVIGVPCNQFGDQEPGSAEDIAAFCRLEFGVSFPLLKKQDVGGAHRSPLYAALIDSPVGAGLPVRWNFEKFLVSRNGEVLARFDSDCAPDHPALLAALEHALARD
ncbi:glutathione peroxidase [Chromobacterium vaccinii]|uniref:Glutathione peroxidase n=1 Tax=Chromobacterium vaccinii TaxID=1108595 RepID=A0A1D9LGH8_9NEIS|nr:glutathione peroxidase [Chromobacterium vaccinii]AOZ50383.1 glutathione peroxidase [Chromobacterium vaccinii]QND83317.1 Glutathione peroxidase [Chromobacterium vaccinii]QND88548.1 Glutathione peroxidase [Chromobacterium vaccinii]